MNTGSDVNTVGIFKKCSMKMRTSNTLILVKNYPQHLFYHVPILESYIFLRMNKSSIGSSVKSSYLGSFGS